MQTRIHILVATVLGAVLLAAPAQAQQASGGKSVGVVTALQGQATVAREALPQPAALHFKDDVFFQDRITTRERSTVRLLLGGKGVLTIREQSQVTLDESVGPEGGRQSILGLLAGKIGAAVSRALMSPGEAVEIRTPNAVAAVRGTVLIAEYIPPKESAEVRAPVLLASSAPGPFLAQGSLIPGGVSNFFVLDGQVTITPQGQPPVTLGPLQSVSVSVTPGGAQAGTVQNITPADAAQAAQGLQAGKPHTGETESSKAAQTQTALALATFIAESTAGQPSGTPASTAPTTSTPSTTVAPVVPTVLPAATGTNLIFNPGFETGDFTNWSLGSAASVISDFGPGVFSPPAGNYMALIHTGSGATNNTTTTLSQSIQSLSTGSVYLITFDYNFLSNEFPTQATTFNDTFEATLESGETRTLLARETRNSSTFNTDQGSISGGGFTLSAENGYTGFKSASKTVVAESGSATLEFKIFDVGDTAVDSAALIDKVSVALDPPLYLLTRGQTLTHSAPTPLVEVSDRSLTLDSVLVSSGPPPATAPSVELGGPLLTARRSSLNVPFSLLGLLDGSTLRTSSSGPLVELAEGAYALSTRKGAALFDFWGTQTALDVETGVPVGTTQTLEHAGPLLEASGGATVTTHKVLKLDTALLAATAPVIRLLGAAQAHTALTSASTPLELIQSKITSLGPLVALDKGTLTVTDGPLLTLSHGSHVDVAGSLVSLLNQSKIHVVNGPLVLVAGAGSMLKVSDALVSFGGTGNQVIVNNTIVPTAVQQGIPVSVTGPGASVTIGPNPILNPVGNTFSVTGSAIQATNGGKVWIGAGQP